jgi:hypothetical protein
LDLHRRQITRAMLADDALQLSPAARERIAAGYRMIRARFRGPTRPHAVDVSVMSPSRRG